LLAPWLAPYDPIKVDPAAALSRPGVAHPLGTDRYGRDILSRVLVGARLSLLRGWAPWRSPWGPGWSSAS